MPRDPDDSDIAGVLRAVGRRDEPPTEIKSAVRTAVENEWRAVVAERSRKRRWSTALAASIAVVAVGALATQFWVKTPYTTIGSVSRIEGVVSSRDPSWMAQFRAWQPASPRQSLRSGQELMTGREGRVALTWADGISVRLDRNTRITIEGTDRIEVESGAVYVDSGNARAARSLAILTPAGVVRHLGTQYEVRLLASDVRISVREGHVELSTASGRHEQVHAGEQLTVVASGGHQRAGIESDGEGWAWINEVAPHFEIEGRSLRDFLTWAGRELGRQIVFADPASEMEATQAILHGSIAGLPPDQALAAVLPTTPLRGTQQDGRILVERQ